MKKILWISPYAPYDKVAHAGGKSHNYYIKYMHKSGDFDITLLSLCLKSEEDYLDLDQYGIKNHIYVMDQTKLDNIIRRGTSAFSYLNPFDKYAGICLTYERKQILKLFDEYKSDNTADIVVLQWTFAVVLAPIIRRQFPNAKMIAIEEDVTFLGYQRKKECASSFYQRWFWKQRHRHMKKMELDLLNSMDMVITNNPKDTDLLLENGIDPEKIFTSAPYFKKYGNVVRSEISKDILFFGAMSRAENYKSAIWFIEKVLPYLEDSQTRFIVVGGNPDNSLKSLESDRVIVTGYVDDVSVYFKNSLCLVAPLLFGAGIKVKILEAMSSGIPVITNQIGIEGILAQDKKEYFHCETAQEYIACINNILKDKTTAEKIGFNGKCYISSNYNVNSLLDTIIDKLR